MQLYLGACSLLIPDTVAQHTSRSSPLRPFPPFISLLFPMPEHISPPLDIQKFALDTAHHLSSFPHFLEASERLLSHNHLFTDAVIQLHGRKVGFRLMMPLMQFSQPKTLAARNNRGNYLSLLFLIVSHIMSVNPGGSHDAHSSRAQTSPVYLMFT